MQQAVSCGGVVIFKGKILLLYKKYKNKYDGWVLPKGTVEEGEEFQETALREVKEETSVDGHIMAYVGESHYSFTGTYDLVEKTVHWYVMQTDSFFCKPQEEEDFYDVGFYKYHEAVHLLKFADERQILEQAYEMYLDLKRNGNWCVNDKRR